MPSKVTDLAAQTGALLAAADLFLTIDVSDTSMAVSGTDKKLTYAELLNALNALYTALGAPVGGALTGTLPAPTLAAGAVRTYGGIITMGHSYTQVAGGGDSAAQRGDTLTNFTHRIAASLGVPAEEVFLLGKSGAAASSPDDFSGGTSQGTGMVLKHILPNHIYSGLVTPPAVEPQSSFPGLFVIMQGYNDIGWSAVTATGVAEWNQNGRNAFRWGMRVYASRPKAKQLHLYNDAAIVYGGAGAWADNAQTAYSTRGTTKRNSTSGGTLTFTIPTNYTGGVVAICLFGGSNGYTTTTNAATSTSLPVANRSQFPQSGNFDILIGGVAATVTGGHGTGAGTFTLSVSKTWVNGAVVTRAQAGTINWTGTAQGGAPTCVPSAPSTTSTTVSGQGRNGYPIPVVVRFTGLTRADAGKTIIGTSASLGSNEYFEVDSVWIEDSTPSTVLLLNQPYGPFSISNATTHTKTNIDNLNTDIATVAAEHTEGYTAVVDLCAQFNAWFGATVTTVAGATTLTADIASGVSSIPVTSRTDFPQSGSFKLQLMNLDSTNWEEVTVIGGWGSGTGSFTISGTTTLAHTAASTTLGVGSFDVTVADNTQTKIGVGSILKATVEAMAVTSITPVTGSRYTIGVRRNYDGSTAANLSDFDTCATQVVSTVINDIRWIRSDKVHPSDYGHRLITQLVLEKAATIAQSSYQIANAGAYIARRQPGIRHNTYITPSGSRNLGAAGFGTANVEYAVPILIPAMCELVEIGFYVEVLSASTGAVGRLGIRLDSGNGTPGYLLADFGQTAADITTTGFKNITGLWQPLKPGWFWLCFIPQGTWPAATVKLTDISQLSGTGISSPYLSLSSDNAPSSTQAANPSRYPPIGMSYSCTATFTGAFDSLWMNPFTSGAAQTALNGNGKSDEVPCMWIKLAAPIRD